MINTQLLTKENGFDDGVVVEIGESFGGRGGGAVYFSYGVFMGVDTHGDILAIISSDDDDNEPSVFDIEWVTSIRPLTGPMSIWNHIPLSVAAIVRDELNYPTDLFFYTNPCVIGGDKTYHGKPIECRPFWATRGGE